MTELEVVNAGFDDIPKNALTFTSYLAAVNVQKTRANLVGQSDVLPTRVLLYKGPKFNQGSSKETTYACGMFGISNAVGVRNAVEGSFGVLPEATPDPFKGWIELCTAAYGAKKNAGSSMSQNLDWAKDKEYIDAFYVSRLITELKKALYMKSTIFCGFDDADYDKMKTNGFMYVPAGKDTGGHLWCIVGYDEEMTLNGKKSFFICLDNYGTLKWNGGYFYVQCDDLVKKCYTPCVLIDHPNDISHSQLAMDVADIQKSIDLKIWNGQRQKAKVTYYEAALMIVRGVIGNNKISDVDALKMAQALMILPPNIKMNETDVYRQDFIAMLVKAFQRDRDVKNKADLLQKAFDAGLWNGTMPQAYATREQGALLVVRAMRLFKEGKL